MTALPFCLDTGAPGLTCGCRRCVDSRLAACYGPWGRVKGPRSMDLNAHADPLLAQDAHNYYSDYEDWRAPGVPAELVNTEEEIDPNG